MLMKHLKIVAVASPAGLVSGAVLAAFCACGAAPALAGSAPLESEWSRSYNAQTRLVAGTAAGGADARSYAGVEIRMNDGWKTYWKYPGDAGGVPPVFDWSGSTNLKSAEVLYPAPHRMTDQSGDSIGYKNAVVFPVAVEPRVPGEPVELKVKIDYGVCREICVPAESSLSLTIPPGSTATLPEDLATAIDLVPRQQDARRTNDPEFKSAVLETAVSPPKIKIEAAFPGGGEDADAFVEGPQGVYLPLPRKVGKAESGATLFEIELEPGDIADLKGKPLSITLVSASGQSQATFKLEEQAAAQ